MMIINTLILFSVITYNAYAFRVFQVNGVETMLALKNEELNIQCKADVPMAYCGFIHPNGTRYSFSDSSLEAGQCSYKTNVSEADSGIWRCHIGRKGSIGVEIMQRINVRVVRHVAAIEKNITTIHGKPVTISCATVKGMTPLRYCRFEPPSGQPFSINSDVTPESPILNRFYFPKNKSLDRGDCAVTIRKVKYEDVGQWSCGAGLDDGKEHLDTIAVEVAGLYTMSTASATGITFGALGIASFLIILGIVVWKKRRFLGSMPDEGNEHEMQHLPTTPQRSPCGSAAGLPRSPRGSAAELQRSLRGSIAELQQSPRSSRDDPIQRIPLHGSQPLITQRTLGSQDLAQTQRSHGSRSSITQRSMSAKNIPQVFVQSPTPVASPASP